MLLICYFSAVISAVEANQLSTTIEDEREIITGFLNEKYLSSDFHCICTNKRGT